MKNMVMTKEQIVALADGHEVTNSDIFDDDGFIAAQDGLFDNTIFGETIIGTVDSKGIPKADDAGMYAENMWGYINFPVPVFHPSLITHAACEDEAFFQWVYNRGNAGEDPTDIDMVSDLEQIIYYGSLVRFDTEIPTLVPAKEAKDAKDTSTWDYAWGIDALVRLCGQEFVDRWCLTSIPVVPVAYRKIFKVEDSGKYAFSDLNDLYRRVINRSNRLHRLKELNAPDIIIMNESRILQESVEALFMNGAKRPPLKDPSGHALVPLARYFASAVSPTSSFVYAQAMGFDVSK